MPEFLRQRGAGIAGRLFGIVAFADFLFVHARAEQSQRRILRRAGTAAARVRPAATAALGIDAFGLQQ